MKRGTFDHPKLGALSRLLGIERAHALGLLELLCNDFAAWYAPDGCVGKFPEEEIARGAGWEHDAHTFVSALVQTGWLDADADGVLWVHDYAHHRDRLTVDRLRKRRELQKKRPRGNFREKSRNGLGKNPIRPVENLTPSGAGAGAGAGAGISTGKEPNGEIISTGEGIVCHPGGAGAARTTTRPAARGSRLDPEAELPAAWRTWVTTEFPVLPVDAVWAEFRDYWIGVPGQRGCKVNWEATFRNRCRQLAVPGLRPQRAAGPTKAEQNAEAVHAAVTGFARKRGW